MAFTLTPFPTKYIFLFINAYALIHMFILNKALKQELLENLHAKEVGVIKLNFNGNMSLSSHEDVVVVGGGGAGNGKAHTTGIGSFQHFHNDTNESTIAITIQDQDTNITAVSVVDDKSVVDNPQHTFPYDGGDNDNKKIIDILSEAGVKVTDEMKQSLPTMSNFTSLYGSPKHSKIIGLDTCKAFQANTDPKERVVGPSGLYNTGTNLVSRLMQKHCYIKERYGNFSGAVKNLNDQMVATGMFDDVPWGKHGPLRWREDDDYRPGQFPINKVLPHLHYDNVFPIVIVKDPYFWMKSTCDHSYTARWTQSTRSSGSCMNLNDPDQSVRVKFEGSWSKKWRQTSRIVRYKNLVDMWNSYYNDYINATFPRAVIRYEDLLLYVNEIIPQLCECVGGTTKYSKNNENRKSIYISRESAKGKGHGKTNGLVESVMKYGNSEKRSRGFTRGDLEFAHDTMDQDLMRILQYSFLSNVTKQRRRRG